MSKTLEIFVLETSNFTFLTDLTKWPTQWYDIRLLHHWHHHPVSLSSSVYSDFGNTIDGSNFICGMYIGILPY